MSWQSWRVAPSSSKPLLDGKCERVEPWHLGGLSNHRFGELCVCVSVLCVVPDATLVRLIRARSIVAAMWRMALIFVGLSVITGIRYGRKSLGAIRNMGPWGAVVCFCSGFGPVCFIMAVSNTSVANVVLILASGAFWAALMTRAVLGTAVPRRTWLAMPVVFGGIVVAFREEVKGGRLRIGDAFAFAVTLGGATRRTIMRAHPEIDMSPASLVGSLCVALSLAACFKVTGTDMTVEGSDLYPLAAMGILLTSSAFLNATGARYISSAESSLMMCLETVLSPLLAAAVLGEELPADKIFGGFIVVSALVAHAVWPGSDR